MSTEERLSPAELEAFGAELSVDTIWGFNVTRFDAEHEEFSTWSGAVDNAYDPLSLGNLLLPSVPSSDAR